MKNTAGILNRMTRPVAACALAAVAIASFMTAPAATNDELRAIGGKVKKGDVQVPQIPEALAAEPLPQNADTITPNTPHWSLPLARPGAEPPAAGASRLKPIYVRPTTVAADHPARTHGPVQFPALKPQTALAWSQFPRPSELSVPSGVSGPDRHDAVTLSDPTAVQSHMAVLRGRPILREKSAAFLRLNIPDPFGRIDAIRLDAKIMPPDNDPPTPSRTPADPTMPVTARRR